MMQDVYIVKAKRTPVCKAYKGGLAKVRPDDLLANVLKGLLEGTGVDSAVIEDVIIGCAMPEAEQGMNVARIATLLAGYSDRVPAMTVNRFCSSGLQTIALAANQIATGCHDVVIAGGVESMSMVPLGGYNYRANINIFDQDNSENIGIAYGMGITAELVADKWQITRQLQDEFALNSHKKAINAINNGLFNDEIIPYTVVKKHGSERTSTSLIVVDDGARADTDLEKLAKLPSFFKLNGTVTAGNSSQMSDGAAALLLMSESALKKYNLKPLAKLKGFSVAGVSPEIMSIGPIAAIPKCLAQCGLSLNNIDVIELNEAFAAQSLAVIKELDIDSNKVNPLGGAIALGHPLGATGAIKACTILHHMQRNNLKYGLVTMCIGTGMGAAGIFEMV